MVVQLLVIDNSFFHDETSLQSYTYLGSDVDKIRGTESG